MLPHSLSVDPPPHSPPSSCQVPRGPPRYVVVVADATVGRAPSSSWEGCSVCARRLVGTRGGAGAAVWPAAFWARSGQSAATRPPRHCTSLLLLPTLPTNVPGRLCICTAHPCGRVAVHEEEKNVPSHSTNFSPTSPQKNTGRPTLSTRDGSAGARDVQHSCQPGLEAKRPACAATSK